MKAAIANEFFSIPAQNSQCGYILIAPGDIVMIGSELYPALPPQFPSARAVVVVSGNGIGLVDSGKVVLKGDLEEEYN